MRDPRLVFSGTIYDPERGLVEGSAVIEPGIPIEISERRRSSCDVEGTLLPGFVDAHTHMGDACIGALPDGLDLVGFARDPDGYKHRVLAATPDNVKVDAMRMYLIEAFRSGICETHDFREEGIHGLRGGERALERAGVPLTLRMYGRPASRSDPERVIMECEGFGLSSLTDVTVEVCERLADLAHRSGRSFALHASEAEREDIATILRMGPRFLVHMCAATPEDIEACARSNVAIVVCPRANAAFGRRPPVEKMLESGVDILLGTDNACISSPDMFEEMRFLYLRGGRRIPPGDILDMALKVPRKVFNIGGGMGIWGHAVILDKVFREPEAIILRGGRSRIHRILVHGAPHGEVQS